MFTKEAIEQLQHSNQSPKVIEINGYSYLVAPGSMAIKQQMPATPHTLFINTLAGVVEYLRHCNPEAELWDNSPKDSKYLIHIEDYSTVKIISPLEPVHMTRRCFIQAKARPNEFKLGQYMDTERFIVSAMSSFVPTERLEKLMDFISQIKAGSTREEVDNRVSQTVTVQKTVATLGLAEVPNPVELNPYLTFPEIEQPQRSYVFRIRQPKTPEDPIMIALFPIESSVWEAEACEAIRLYFMDVEKKFPMNTVIIS